MTNVTKLSAELTEDRRLYYIGKPRISDDKFDDKERLLRSLDPNDDYFNHVGTPNVNSRAMVKHDTFMGSLNNAFNEDEIRAWLTPLTSQIAEHGLPSPKSLIVTPKMDGLSVQLSYRNGRLDRAALRNTGYEGEDVTANILNSGVPRVLDWHDSIDIRGEVVIHTKAFRKQLAGDYANERAAAAGILRGGAQTHVHLLRLYTFGAVPINMFDPKAAEKRFSTLSGILEWLAFNRFRFVPWEKIEFDPDGANIIEAWKKYLDRRHTLPYLIDGMVVALNSMKAFRALGMSATCPRGAVACKWRGQQVAVSKIVGLRNQVGHTGKITPVALIDPVQCGGVVIQNASLMNWDEIRRIDVGSDVSAHSGIGVGAEVRIERVGDIIPRVVELLKDAKVRFERPEKCPVCDAATVADGPFQKCTNADCSAQTMGKIMRWLKGRNILHIGEETVDRLMSVGGPLRTIDDLYTLSRSHLIDATRSESTADRIMAELEKSRDCTPTQLLGNIGMPGIGEGEADKVVKQFKIDSHRKLMDAWELPNLLAECIGPVTSQKFIRGVNKYHTLIQKLWKLLRVATPKALNATKEWDGKTFCITGPTEIPRPMLIKAIKAAGGIWKSTVVNGLDYLILADEGTKKAKAAKAKGVKIVSEIQALEWAKFG